MRHTLACALLVLCVTSSACRIGPSSTVLAEANVQVLVTGLVGGERVELDVAGQQRITPSAPRAVLVLALTLPAGTHDGVVVVSAGASPPRCAPFSVALRNDHDSTSTAVDAATAPICAPVDAGLVLPDAGLELPDAGLELPDAGLELPDAGLELPDAGLVLPDAGLELPDAGLELPDAGLVLPDAGTVLPDAGVASADAGVVVANPFVRLSETITTVPCLFNCLQTTTIDASGAVQIAKQGAATRNGVLGALDVDALGARVTSSEADALFGGHDASCLQLGVLQGLDVLQRTTVRNDVTATESVDVSLCLTGIAADLKARAALARTAVP
jgi:hypothetical protein